MTAHVLTRKIVMDYSVYEDRASVYLRQVTEDFIQKALKRDFKCAALGSPFLESKLIDAREFTAEDRRAPDFLHRANKQIESMRKAIRQFPRRLGDCVYEDKFLLAACRRVDDHYDKADMTDVTGLCLLSSGFMTVYVPMVVVGKDGREVPNTRFAEIVTHELAHVVAFRFFNAPDKLPLHDRKDYSAACERDRPAATAYVEQLKKKNGSPAEIGFILDQLDPQTGPRELFANHVFHLLSGNPAYDFLPDIFSHSLRATYEMLDDMDYLDEVRPGVMEDAKKYFLPCGITRYACCACATAEVLWIKGNGRLFSQTHIFFREMNYDSDYRLYGF